MGTPLPTQFNKWDTYITQCGAGRISYHPDWSPSMPWASYWGGTAGRHFSSVAAASEYFRTRFGATLETGALRGAHPNN